MKLKLIEDKIKLVTESMLTKFPGCQYTIKILLWTDGTDLVECRHGNMDKIHNFRYYNNELIYEEVKFDHARITIDEKGKEYFILDK